MNHGCHCIRLSDYSLGGGDIQDDLDGKCKAFFEKRSCIKQTGPAGVCYNVDYAGDTYTAQLVNTTQVAGGNNTQGPGQLTFGADPDFHCALETDPCKNAICRIDHQAIFELITYEIGHAGHAYIVDPTCNRYSNIFQNLLPTSGHQNYIQCVGPVPNVARVNQFAKWNQTPSKTATAKMYISGDYRNGRECYGAVFLKQFEDPKRIEISHDIYDCGAYQQGYHGFNVHLTNDFSNGCHSTLGVYNPGNVNNTADAVGTLRSIPFDDTGSSNGMWSQIDDRAFLDVEWSVANRSLVIQSMRNDRLLCGEIVLDEEPDFVAEVNINPRGNATNEGCTGIVRLRQFTSRYETEFWYSLSGCGAYERGLHGLHVHVNADYSSDCDSTGPYYNPHNRRTFTDQLGHLTNIHMDGNGNASGAFIAKNIFLNGTIYGEGTIDGLPLVFHGLPYQNGRPSSCDMDNLGQGGGFDGSCRLACGTINIVSGSTSR